MSVIFPLAENGLEGYRFVLEIPVQFRDVDGMGHLNNVAYFALLETTRIEYMIHLTGLHDCTHEMNSMPFILASQAINYRSPAFYRETLLVGVRTNWIKRSSFGFEFEMRDKTSLRLVADGNGTHVIYDYQAGRSMAMPEDWLKRLEEFEGRQLKE